MCLNSRRRNFAAFVRTRASGRKVVLAKQLVCATVVAALVAHEKVLAKIRSTN